MPPTMAVPDVGLSSPHSMRIVVDLPAPLLPRKPKISPCSTSKDTRSTARKRPNRRVRSRTVTAGIGPATSPGRGRGALRPGGPRQRARPIELGREQFLLRVEHLGARHEARLEALRDDPARFGG